MGETGGMTHERWRSLLEDDSLRLTPEELAQGWHFCPDWDGLLVGPGMEEMEYCLCGNGI